ncbi:hypothetical protein RF11_01691 [Thelohanellus kitauei]|uniref:Uncharacterized protein n=1 Tax=Thelohanellus kitauei TaxID=669202 RepID=A0A0C2N5Y7_THEKT|nr:hypothetical protein RF11_01691 [Thelohanellus kitauei]
MVTLDLFIRNSTEPHGIALNRMEIPTYIKHVQKVFKANRANFEMVSQPRKKPGPAGVEPKTHLCSPCDHPLDHSVLLRQHGYTKYPTVTMTIFWRVLVFEN